MSVRLASPTYHEDVHDWEKGGVMFYVLDKVAPGRPNRVSRTFSHGLRKSRRSNIHDDVGLTVALVEIEGIREFLILNNTQAATRFNYYLVLVSAACVGTAALLGSQESSISLHPALIAGIAGAVLSLGVLTFERIARSDITRAEYLAMLSLYRSYLLQRAPDLSSYNILPVQFPGQRRSPWRVQSALSNLAVTAAIINSLSATVVGAALTQALAPGTTLVPAIGAISLMLVSAAQAFWLKRNHSRGNERIDALLQAPS